MTEARQGAPAPDPESGGVELSPRQMVGLNAMLEGKTQSQAAEIAGVTRQSLNKWVHENPTFKRLLDEGRAKLLAAAEEERIKAERQVARSLGNTRKLAALAAERAMARIAKRVSLPRDDKDFLEIRPFEAVALMDAAVKVGTETFGTADGENDAGKLTLRELAQQVIDRQQSQFGEPIEAPVDASKETTEKLEGLGAPGEQTNGGG